MQYITSHAVRTVKQKNLTAECWLIQIVGRAACETCEVKDTEDCGGQDILKSGKNSKGLNVPVE